jgi:hypothetical protein
LKIDTQPRSGQNRKKKLHGEAALASDKQLFIGTVNDAARGPQTAKWSYTIWSFATQFGVFFLCFFAQLSK